MQKNKGGALVGSIIIIVILILAGIYFWKTTKNDMKYEQVPVEDTTGITENLKTQGTSDEVSDIEADLNATDFENLDTDLDLNFDDLGY